MDEKHIFETKIEELNVLIEQKDKKIEEVLAVKEAEIMKV